MWVTVLNEIKPKKALVEGTGEIIKADGTVIPITLRAETDLSLEEIRDRTGLEVTEQEE